MLSFGISIGVGLSPLLGRARVPGFASLLSLYPAGLAQIVIPFAALVMSLPALAVQYLSLGKLSSRRLTKWFAWTLVLAAVLILIEAGLYSLFVVQVPVEGGHAFAAFVVGFEQRPDSKCGSLSIKTCIGHDISFDPNEVESQFPDWQVSVAKLALTTGYCICMCALGASVGLIVLREYGSA